MSQKRNAYRVVVGKPAGSRPRGRPRRGRENNLKMDVKKQDEGRRADRSGDG